MKLLALLVSFGLASSALAQYQGVTASGPTGSAGGDLAGLYPNPTVAKVNGATATTVGANIFSLTNPGAISFIKIAADNSVSAESASAHRSSLGLGTSATVDTGTSGTKVALTDGVITWSGLQTANAGITVSGSALTLSGNQSAAAWTTSGLRIKGVAGTLTDTTSATGTVAAAYTDKLGGNTIAATNAGVVYTEYASMKLSAPIAGTNVTITNPYALDADSAIFGTSNPTTVSSGGILSATNAVLTTPNLGTPSALVLTNASGTGSFNINGTVGATTPAAGTFTTGVFGSTTSLLLGTAGSAVGNIGFRNATSGTATLAPPTGALGTYTVTLPNAASTLPISGQQITWSGPTASRTYTLPDAADTLAGLAQANVFTAKQKFSTGTQVTQLWIKGDGSGTPTSTDLYILQSASYPYMQFVNDASGGASGDGFKLGIEATAGAVWMKENWPIDFYTNNLLRWEIAAAGHLLSTTALATPSALSATQFTGFASTVSGASLMGYGTTNDVSLMNRAGTVVLGVGPNTTTVNIPATLSVTGASTLTGKVGLGAPITLKGYTVATLPASPVQGDTAFVTDALTPAFLTIITGGGSTVAPVFYNGTNWVGY